ncbi:MAG: anti-phage deoxyguanosine triphosphatase [Sagittula sp.]|uniref:anti-phage deoxyguanosine triphosphatase n=1 Tax=Sagittula sp. TaxID=2038081 RepID=UPI0040580DE8
MSSSDQTIFAKRQEPEESRPGDKRQEFSRDRARVIHSAGFRRLQGKTQVMGVGEGDFHRTRLTHSVECAQIGYGLLEHVPGKERSSDVDAEIEAWLPSRDLLEAACLAHDLGHPPFGHGGERALHAKMRDHGGFEGNGQTLRILTRLEKHRQQGKGLNPTRRLVLAILKYPVPYGSFDLSKHDPDPPKCFFDEEKEIVDWAMEPFHDSERHQLKHRDPDKDRPIFHTLDCSIMELADDIAYGIHDLEDIAGRQLVPPDEFREAVVSAFDKVGGSVGAGDSLLTGKGIADSFSNGAFERKPAVSRLVNHFITAARIERVQRFMHPLLAHKVDLPDAERELLGVLKKVSYSLVVKRAHVQQLERRGQRVVANLYDAFMDDPKAFIPTSSLEDLRATGAPTERVVCDYVAGMTDRYAEMVYHRFFTPGFGSSGDEI